MLFKETSKCKETREERLFLARDKRRNAFPYLVRLKQGHPVRIERKCVFDSTIETVSVDVRFEIVKHGA